MGYIRKQDVVDLVGRNLKPTSRCKVPWDVIEEGVKRERGWWYVPVKPRSRRIRRMYDYYDYLAKIETRLKNKDDVRVFLMPVPPD